MTLWCFFTGVNSFNPQNNYIYNCIYIQYIQWIYKLEGWDNWVNLRTVLGYTKWMAV